MSDKVVSSVVKLTRACEACVKAKRKCSLSYPICDRCKSREINCAYKNIPLGGGLSQERSREFSRAKADHDVSTGSAEPSGVVLVPKLVQRLPEPPCIVPTNDATTSFMLKLAKRHVLNFGTQGGNVFMHKDIAPSQVAKNLQALCRQSTVIACRRLKVELEVQEQLGYTLGALNMMVQRAPDVWQMLACVQCLTLVQIITLFILSSSPAHRYQAEMRQHMLFLWTKKLWMMAPSQLPSSLTPREAFLLAESVRRTIIVSSDLQALNHSIRYGWIEHNIFLDALPFERRAALWDVPDEEFDGHFAGAKQDIISWREFADMFDAGLVSSTMTSFEVMLLVGAKTKPVVEAQLKAASPGHVALENISQKRKSFTT